VSRRNYRSKRVSSRGSRSLRKRVKSRRTRSLRKRVRSKSLRSRRSRRMRGGMDQSLQGPYRRDPEALANCDSTTAIHENQCCYRESDTATKGIIKDGNRNMSSKWFSGECEKK